MWLKKEEQRLSTKLKVRTFRALDRLCTSAFKASMLAPALRSVRITLWLLDITAQCKAENRKWLSLGLGHAGC